MRRNILFFTALCQVTTPRWRPTVVAVLPGVYQVGPHTFTTSRWLLGMEMRGVEFSPYLPTQLTPVPSAPSFVGG